MSRLLLQICTAALALVPIITGVVSMRGARDPRRSSVYLLAVARSSGLSLVAAFRSP
jgi:hypothetical protein